MAHHIRGLLLTNEQPYRCPGSCAVAIHTWTFGPGPLGAVRLTFSKIPLAVSALESLFKVFRMVTPQRRLQSKLSVRLGGPGPSGASG